MSEVGAVGAPPVPLAVEESVRAFLERLPVVRAGDWGAVTLVCCEGSAFVEDVDELVPGAAGVCDDGSPPSMDGPP